MSNEDKKIERNFAETNQGITPRLRDYFKALNTALIGGGGWSTTSTTTTSTSSSTSTSTSSTSSTSSTTA